MCLGKTETRESQTIGAVNSDVDGGHRETACLGVDGMMGERRRLDHCKDRVTYSEMKEMSLQGIRLGNSITLPFDVSSFATVLSTC